MPEYENCTKIHEGCGGIVRWVEAVDVPGVGYQGECLACKSERLTVEEILPIRELDNKTALHMSKSDLAELEWDDDETWRHNQKRLGKKAEKLS